MDAVIIHAPAGCPNRFPTPFLNQNTIKTTAFFNMFEICHYKNNGFAIESSDNAKNNVCLLTCFHFFEPKQYKNQCLFEMVKRKHSDQWFFNIVERTRKKTNGFSSSLSEHTIKTNGCSSLLSENAVKTLFFQHV